MLTLEEAAVELDISVNAVRQRIKRGTVVAVKSDAGWLVNLAATDQRHTTKRPTTQPTDHVVDPTNQQPTTDLAPLAGVIRDQNRQITDQAERIVELSATAAMWQTRALHLQEEVEQLKQLTATVESPEGPESDETDDQVSAVSALHQQETSTPPEGIWACLRRWWKG